MKNWRDKFPFDSGLILAVLQVLCLAIFFICAVVEILDIFHFSTKEAKVFKALLPISFILSVIISQLQVHFIARNIYKNLLPDKAPSLGKYKFFFNFAVVAVVPLALVFYLLLQPYLEKRKYISKVENAVSLYSNELEKLEFYLSNCELYREKNTELSEDLEKASEVNQKIRILRKSKEIQNKVDVQNFGSCYSVSQKCEKDECDYFSKVFNDNSQEIFYKRLEKEHLIYIPVKGETSILLFEFPIEEKK